MAKFNFYLRDKKKDGDTPVILFISHNGNRLKYSTDKSINPKYWNEDSQSVRQVKEFPTAKIFNDRLKYIKAEAEKIFYELERDLTHPPSNEQLKKKLDQALKDISEVEENPDREPTFLELFDRFIKESENGTRLNSKGERFNKRSIQKYKTTERILKEFGEKYHLSFESINKKFYDKFIQYLYKQDYLLNTVGKHIQVVKTFMAYATDNGYNSNLYFQSKQFKVLSEPGFSIYLSEDEIQILYEKDLSKTPHLERVRDLFIVGCWTGLRFSDFTNIKSENIDGGMIRIKTFKTGESVVIPIHPLIRQIMEKYRGIYPNSLPPAISNQKMNSYLKDIAREVDCLKKLVEVEYTKGGMKWHKKEQKCELVSTHTARRSFATNLYKSGFPSHSIMKITGHRTEKSFLLYIKVTPEENAKLLMEHWNKSILKVS